MPAALTSPSLLGLPALPHGRASAGVGRTNQRSFSLIEVILAVGLFASAVAIMIALLPALARRGAESSDVLAAQRLTDALHRELMRLGASDFDALAGQIPEMTGTLPAGLACVADRPARQLHSRDYQLPANGGLPAGDRYFLVECWRFADEPLRYDSSRACLALAVRVSWPYQLPGMAGPTTDAGREHLWFTAAINR